MSAALVLGGAAAAAADTGSSSVALWVAVLALVSGLGAALLGLFGKRGEVSVTAQGQLSASQVKFIETVQADNAAVRKDNEELRARLDRLEAREEKLLDRVSVLEGFLRQNGIAVPPPLRFDVAG